MTDSTSRRVDVVEAAREAHTFAYASSANARDGEHWRCRCGLAHHGEGSLAFGRRHEAEQIVAALDAHKETPDA